MGYTISSWGGDSDGAYLEGYQFILVPGSSTFFNFCAPSPANTVVATSPASFTNGTKFTFNLPIGGTTYKWEISHYTLGSTTPGKWKNNHKPELADDSDGENGTFTAQSGAGEEEIKGKGKPAQAY
jgi:hypothetical protein